MRQVLRAMVAVSLLGAPTLWIGEATLNLVQDGKRVYAADVPDGQSNGMLPPLVDLGFGQTYNGQEGGLYPGGSNARPAAHDAAGRKIARGIVPLDVEGNRDPVNGKIVIMPVSVSNGYGAWHLGDAGDTSTTFMTRANANPAKTPKLFIAYLTYTWSCSGPAGVTFSVNGPNRAKNTTVTFPSAGRYIFDVTFSDVGGLTATNSIVVTVTQR